MAPGRGRASIIGRLLRGLLAVAVAFATLEASARLVLSRDVISERVRGMSSDAWSNNQINRILQPFAPTNGYVDVSSDDTGALFYCYGSVLDSQTSDPTTILPQ